MTTPDIHIHIHGLADHTVQLNRMEHIMASAAEQLTALQTQLTDTTTDVLAKLDQLAAQAGNLSPEAQATFDSIVAAVTALDTTVGDADGSDNPPV